MADPCDVRDLKIEATAYPPGEPPQDITIVHDVSFTLKKGRCWA
jgi:peptide/nickel transport system ATP-binding protein